MSKRKMSLFIPVMFTILGLILSLEFINTQVYAQQRSISNKISISQTNHHDENNEAVGQENNQEKENLSNGEHQDQNGENVDHQYEGVE